VSTTAIGQIRRGVTWKDVAPAPPGASRPNSSESRSRN
jgi:hypothetical protein